MKATEAVVVIGEENHEELMAIYYRPSYIVVTGSEAQERN